MGINLIMMNLNVNPLLVQLLQNNYASQLLASRTMESSLVASLPKVFFYPSVKLLVLFICMTKKSNFWIFQYQPCCSVASRNSSFFFLNENFLVFFFQSNDFGFFFVLLSIKIMNFSFQSLFFHFYFSLFLFYFFQYRKSKFQSINHEIMMPLSDFGLLCYI